MSEYSVRDVWSFHFAVLLQLERLRGRVKDVCRVRAKTSAEDKEA